MSEKVGRFSLLVSAGMILANVSVFPCFMVAIRSPIISNCSSVRVEYVFGVPPGCKRILIVELFGELRIHVLGAEGAGRRVERV